MRVTLPKIGKFVKPFWEGRVGWTPKAILANLDHLTISVTYCQDVTFFNNCVKARPARIARRTGDAG